MAPLIIPAKVVLGLLSSERIWPGPCWWGERLRHNSKAHTGSLSSAPPGANAAAGLGSAQPCNPLTQKGSPNLTLLHAQGSAGMSSARVQAACRHSTHGLQAQVRLQKDCKAGSAISV